MTTKSISRISGALGAVLGGSALILVDHSMNLSLPARILVGGAMGGAIALLAERMMRSRQSDSSGNQK